jgi:chromosomal replication initiation ATPase DnaA
VTGNAHHSVQLPLDLGHHAGFGIDDLIVGPSNRGAVAFIERWPDWPSPVVVLAGPSGSGKTHLGQIWGEMSDAVRLDAVHLGAAELERAAGRPVLIEDIDRQLIDETGLFHLINEVKATGTSLLITARAFPLSWGVQLPDLASRLKAAATVEIAEPDDMLLAAVITKLFADRQVQVEPHVVQFAVRRMERSLASAERLVEALDRAALERKCRISRGLAGEILDAMEQRQGELGV